MIDIISICIVVLYLVVISLIVLLDQPERNLVLVGVVNDRFPDGKLIWKKINLSDNIAYITIDKKDPFTKNDIETISWIEKNKNIGTPEGILIHNIITKETRSAFGADKMILYQIGSSSMLQNCKQIKEEKTDIQTLLRKYN